MYIRRIILCGFKSYKKKVVLHLSRGHNVVVGANGSGKSNIYAALEFVLSSKYDILRSEHRKQLLHDAGQSGVVSAYVEIIFDNEDGRFPINEPLISIKRSIGAKKDEYFVNQRHCDKSELNNLLESAGISKYNQHFIVPQGQIAARVKERDHERLELIKEIAGTRVYDERRNESQQLMSNADHKREKVKMVIDYFQERLQELKQEKDELQKFERLDLKRRSIEYQIYDKERDATHKSLQKLQENEGKTDEKNEELHEALKEIRNDIDEYTTERNALMNKSESSAKDLKKERKELQSIQRLITSLNTKKKALEKDNENYRGKKNKYDEEFDAIKHKIKSAKDSLSAITHTFDRKQQKEIELREDLKRNESKLKHLYSKKERLGRFKSKKDRNNHLKEMIEGHKKEIMEQEKLCKNITASNKDSNKKTKQYSFDIKQLEKAQKETEKLFAKHEKDKGKYKTRRNTLQNDRKRLWKERNEIKKALQELQRKKEKNATDFRFTMSLNQYQSYQHLKRIQRDIADNGERSRYKLSGRLYGAMIENFSVIDDKYNIAVEAAANSKLFYYLVSNDTVATELIKIMQKERINRVTFIPLNQCRAKERKYPKGSADVIPIMKLLRYDDDIDNIRSALVQIFGNTLIPHSINIGYEYAIRENYQCVTLNGDIVTSGGAIDGGYNQSKYRRLNCYHLIRDINKQYEGLKGRQNEIEESLKEIEQNILTNENEMNSNLTEINNNRDALNRNKEKLIEIAEEIEIEEELVSNNFTILEKHEANMERIRHIIDSLQNEMKHALKNKWSDDEEKAIQDLTKHNQQIAERLAHFVVEMAEIDTEKAKISSLLKDNLNLRQKELIVALKKCDESYDNDEVIDSIANKLQIDNEKKEKLTKGMRNDEKNIDSWNERIKQLEDELLKLSESEQDLLFEIEEHSIDSEKLLGKHQALKDKLNQYHKYIRDLGAISNAEIHKYKNKSLRQLNDSLKEMKKDLMKYENVNKKALDQYNSFNKEKQKLYKRNKDQLTDKDHIEKLMKHLDLKKDDAILRTFHAINDNFKTAFKSLVTRGSAKLMLYEHDKCTQDEEDDADGDDEENQDPDEEKQYTQSSQRTVGRQRRRRRSSNMRQRNRRKSSMISSGSQLDNDMVDKKYAGVGIRVSFGKENEGDDEDEENDRARDMRQLSGGQQTVVALSLIFAIQKCDPSPFYVFDEIDAALDQQYRKAVADLIAKMKDKTQFITTTFRPEILRQADKCFVVDFKAKISTIKEVDVDEVDITKYT